MLGDPTCGIKTGGDALVRSSRTDRLRPCVLRRTHVLSSNGKQHRCSRPRWRQIQARLRILLGAQWGMGDSDSHEHEAPWRPARGPVFDLVGSKLRRLLVRQGTGHRSSLIKRLAQGDGRPVVSVVAPPGYGKTTVLSQWAEHNGQSFAWVSLDEQDNDPKVLLTYVAEALNAVEPIDVHALRNRECQAALSVLADHVPGGSQLAMAGRFRPPLRLARLRAEGRIL